ncbi:hypothetical protein CsSME_00045226 [Camellia sinensis var. sinensis]
MKKHRADDSISIQCRNYNHRKGFFELSLPLIFSFWCLVFLFYSKLGLTHGNEGNLHADNRSMNYSSVCEDKLCNSAYSLVENVNNSYISGVQSEFNASMTRNNTYVHGNHYANPYTLQGTSELEEAIWCVLGYTPLVCGLQSQEQQKEKTAEQLQNGRTHSAYLNLDEFRNITKKEKGGTAASRLVNITRRLEPDGTEYNYASAAKGAKVVAHNKEAKGASNILGKDHDKYLRNPCSVGEKFVVIELAEETLVDGVKIANFEHYSSNFKEFELWGSLIYPTETWSPFGNFVAANVKHAQNFKLPEPKWVRYLKLNLLSHYGSEFYCTLSVVEVYGIDAIERMLEDLIVTSGESTTNNLPDPNSIATPLLIPEPGPSDLRIDGEARNVIEAASEGIEGIDNGQRPNVDVLPLTASNIPDPVMEVRQQPNGRIHADAVLKILMQKVKSLELNLSVLEEYIKELNRRQGDVVPKLDRELSRYSMLVEKTKTEIKNLLEWKEDMEKEVTDFESWKDVVSSQIDALVRENGMLRLDVEKVVSDQASLEKKEIVVLAVSVFFGFLAILKLATAQVLMFFGAPLSNNICRTSRGWILILVSSSITIFITLLCS